ncbi:MAG: hypothetical protein GX754_06665 [Clostridiaceae bacterium]|nr:hypothetical protein [Clostridiaceae bacterium]
MNPLNPYSVFTLLTGLAFAIICIVLILNENKKLSTYVKLADERERQLKEVINDAELIIEELNKLSGYIMAEMEKKKNELQDAKQCIEADIARLNQETRELLNSLSGVRKDKPFSMHLKKGKRQDERAFEEELFPSGGKYSEVLRLSREGMDTGEIARKLRMGKGEVQLVLKSANRV